MIQSNLLNFKLFVNMSLFTVEYFLNGKVWLLCPSGTIYMYIVSNHDVDSEEVLVPSCIDNFLLPIF